jgi:hypothetical protein
MDEAVDALMARISSLTESQIAQKRAITDLGVLLGKSQLTQA